MKILIISRQAEETRRRFQQQQMKKLGLDYEFLDAFEAGDLSDDDCQTAANSWPSPTLRQDVACFTSHRMAWQAVVDRGEKTLILEDDAVLSEDIADALRAIGDRNDDWNCAYDLEFVPLPHILAKSWSWIDRGRRFRATRVFQNRLGLAGYVIGPRAAAKMLEDTGSYALVDAYFWHRSWLKAYQIEPAPVIQLRFVGDHAEKQAFLRTSTDTAFRPRSKLRKNLMRLRLETIKARNLVKGLLGGKKRNIEIDPASFSLGSD
ncbi:glycosyl transferase [Rhizobium sp. Root1203]|uniref:glycosyltransferase family 25 protein n=1 Tax=Rhizobium sp. Root1203 TaxID=1736427 RepID=UPI00070C9820|nr:glycosyltransferase family 25 protein [Rhizobium sp. Root1203]KQV30732.1 glycosyl transferase [Rhizobium sp. Root1203]